jgi:hypothetical protein
MGGEGAFVRANNVFIIPMTPFAISFIKFVAAKFRRGPRVMIPSERVAIAGLVSVGLLWAYIVALDPQLAGGSTLASGLIASAILIIGVLFTLAIYRPISSSKFVRHAERGKEACPLLVRS